ncbi:MAG: pyridoxamine 5'-phosphate oxidase family protein [Anaerolineae bacterium]|nr:pyridoxamine 5'-phosphate oxidase family protein [Anaerolineae bacterium]
MDISYDDLARSIIKQLDKTPEMVLATCAGDRVTARMMSCIHRDLRIYFQTDRGFLKYEQIVQNPNVALCISNMQIEGTARILGRWSEIDDPELKALYRQHHAGSFERYGHRDSQVCIEVTITQVTLWKYEGDFALRDFLHVPEHMARREQYCKVK